MEWGLILLDHLVCRQAAGNNPSFRVFSVFRGQIIK